MSDVDNGEMIAIDIDNSELVNGFIEFANSHFKSCCPSCLVKIMIMAGLNLASRIGELAEVEDKVISYCEGKVAERGRLAS